MQLSDYIYRIIRNLKIFLTVIIPRHFGSIVKPRIGEFYRKNNSESLWYDVSEVRRPYYFKIIRLEESILIGKGNKCE